jgi:hypothetical protein
VKDQYSGDARDYFKYDVLESILLAYGGLEQLTCIWMLTPPDVTGQGRVPLVPDPELPELTRFFRERQDPTRRRVAEMPTYLGRHGHSVFSYRDDRADFSNRARSNYFGDIPATALIASLVFFDPDKRARAHPGQREAPAVLRARRRRRTDGCRIGGGHLSVLPTRAGVLGRDGRADRGPTRAVCALIGASLRPDSGSGTAEERWINLHTQWCRSRTDVLASQTERAGLERGSGGRA